MREDRLYALSPADAEKPQLWGLHQEECHQDGLGIVNRGAGIPERPFLVTAHA